MSPSTYSKLRALLVGKVSDGEMAEFDATQIVKPRHAHEVEWANVPLHERHAFLQARKQQAAVQDSRKHVAAGTRTIDPETREVTTRENRGSAPMSTGNVRFGGTGEIL